MRRVRNFSLLTDNVSISGKCFVFVYFIYFGSFAFRGAENVTPESLYVVGAAPGAAGSAYVVGISNVDWI